MTKQRNSSLELLRIISMLLILGSHFSQFMFGNPSDYSYSMISSQTIFQEVFWNFGRVGCSMFALITGFYSIERNEFHTGKKMIQILGDIHFYAIAIFAITLLFPGGTLGLKAVIKSLFPELWGNWYIKYYLIFLPFIPYICIWLQRLSQKQYFILLVLIVLVWSIVPTMTFKSWSFSDFDFFVVMFLIGGYIKKYVCGKIAYNNWWNFVIAISSMGFMILMNVVIDIVGVKMRQDFVIHNASYFSQYNMVPSLTMAIFAFLYFANKEYYNKVVNNIGKTTLGIYLIHTNGLINRSIWSTVYDALSLSHFPYIAPFVCVAIVFTGCALIEYVRMKTIGRAFYKWLNRHEDDIRERLRRKVSQVLVIAEKVGFYQSE